MDIRDVIDEFSPAIRIRLAGSLNDIGPLASRFPPGVNPGEIIPDNYAPREWIKETRSLEAQRPAILASAESFTYYPFFSKDPANPFSETGPPPLGFPLPCVRQA